MTWGHVETAENRDAMASDCPAFFRSKKSVAMYGRAKITDQPLLPDGLTQAQTRQRLTEAMMMARREALAATARHLWTQRRCSLASICETELRAVTHDILAMGRRE
jgi:hypothetical protein